MTTSLLFPLPGAELRAGLADLPRLLDEALPLSRKHRAGLPAGIAELSRLLTTDREELPGDYLSRPAVLSAYARYFLPWNIYRQGRLLAGLSLALAPGARILDVGAGPLTFALALWLARPDLRGQSLQYLGVDRSEPVLRLGRSLAAALLGQGPWQVRTERGFGGRAAGPPRGPAAGGAAPLAAADLLVVANVLNEMAGIAPPRGARPRQEGQRDVLAELLTGWRRSLGPAGRILIVEPGVRASARLLVRIRDTALRDGWSAEAPCPHQGECPLPGQRGGSWCHFNFGVEGVPSWLADLSRQAGLPKENASLSFLLLRPPRPQADDGAGAAAGRSDDQAAACTVRVISEPFALPPAGRGQYGCCSRGLVLLEHQREAGRAAPGSNTPPGSLLTTAWPQTPRRDPKSGAVILRSDDRPGSGSSPRRPAPRRR